MKKIILSVTNDLSSDQRLNKVCLSLKKKEYEICLIGRKFPKTKKLEKREYKTHRIKIFFRNGPLFYAEYNLKLFFKLLFSSSDIIVANDLDTLLASYFASKFRKTKLVYDSHEYFTEVPELIGRRAKKIWLKIEQLILPKLKNTYTVCESIANEYNRLYQIEMKVVRNLPIKTKPLNLEKPFNFAEKKIILYQGALNIGRGIEHVIRAMPFLENTVFLIIGDGDITEKLKKIANDLNLSDKVIFIGKIPFEKLFSYTQLAHVGISLEEDIGLNYRYALPNKLFDYIKAEVPVLISKLPEMQKVVNKYKIGIIQEKIDNKLLVNNFKELLNNNEKRTLWKKNLKKAAAELHWENEEKELFKIYEQL